MLKKYMLLIILLILPATYVNAELGNFTSKEVIITGFNLESKIMTVSFKEDRRVHTLAFVNGLLEDKPTYYESTTKSLLLKDIPLNKKYYVMTRDNIDTLSKKISVEIYYIGTVPYPF